MAEIGVHEAKTHFSKLLMRVSAGEEIVITRSGEPIARLVPAKRTFRRVLGGDAGSLEVPDDFDAPLPDEVLRTFS